MSKPTYIAADARHEMFYNDVTAAALKHGLQDREIAALLGLILGRMAGVAKATGTQADYDTIVHTAVFNMGKAFTDAPKVLAALGKPQ